MKKLKGIFNIVMLLSVLMALLPTGIAFAGKDSGSVVVEIHNATGGMITMNIVDAKGVHQIFHFQVGVSEMTISQGSHTYAANTGCGTRNGSLNLNVGKQLYFSCGNSTVGISNIAIGYAQATTCPDKYGFGGFPGPGSDPCRPVHHHHGWW